MQPSRRRRGRPSRARGPRRLALVLVGLGLVLAFTLPSSAFTLMDAGRSGAIDVAGDPSGPLGLSVSHCVDKDTIDPLVDAENQFGTSTSVTVSLVDGTLGTLHVGGQSGDTVTFSLASGVTDTVSFETTATGPWPKTLSFTVDATTGNTSATASRSTTIEQNCGTPTPTPTPTATPVPGNEPPTASFTMTAAGGNKMDVDASGSTDSDGTIASYEWYVNDDTASGAPDTTGVTATLNPVRSGDTISLVVTDDDGATDTLTKTVA